MKKTGTEFKRFRVEFKKSVAELEKEFGIKIDLGNITYSSDEFRVKMTCGDAEVGENGKLKFIPEEESKEDKFKQYAIICGAEVDWFGKEFTEKRSTYRITGLNPRARKNKFEITNIKSGQVYVAGLGYIKSRLGLKVEDKFVVLN